MPPTLWSRLDMMLIHASGFAEALRCLHYTTPYIRDVGQDKKAASNAGIMVGHCIANLRKSLGQVTFSASLDAALQRIEARINGDGLADAVSRAKVLTQLEEFETNLLIEFRSYTYLAIGEQRELYEQKEPIFGVKVADTFPDAKADIAAAGRCFALDEWTATVFHLMRAVEFGLRDLAARVGTTFPTPLEYQEWGVIIENIEAQIKKTVAALPKRTPAKSDTSELYSRAASQFYHFKEAWRNHVSHSRRSYDPREAQIVFDSVKAFMQTLAEQP